MVDKKKVAIAVVAGGLGAVAIIVMATRKAQAPPAKTIEVFGPAAPLPPSPSPPPPSPIAIPSPPPPTFVPVPQYDTTTGQVIGSAVPPETPPTPPVVRAQPFSYTFEVDVFLNDLDPVTGLPTRKPLPGASILINAPSVTKGIVLGGAAGTTVEPDVLPGPVSGVTDANGVFQAVVSGVIGTSESEYPTGVYVPGGGPTPGQMTQAFACCAIVLNGLTWSGQVSSPQTYDWNPRGTQVQAGYASFEFVSGGLTKVTVEIVSARLAKYLGP